MTRQSIVWCAALVAVAACQRGDSVAGDGTSAGRTAAPAARGDTPVLTPAPATCGVSADTRLAGDGIGDLRVGAPVESVKRRCRVVRDTTVPGAEGMQERRLVVNLRRDSVVAGIDSNRVWRIHVRTPAFTTADSLGVGTPASALRRPGARLLTGEGAHYVTVPSHCGLSFRLRGVEFGRVTSLSQVAASATVDEVLLIGCTR